MQNLTFKEKSCLRQRFSCRLDNVSRYFTLCTLIIQLCWTNFRGEFAFLASEWCAADLSSWQKPCLQNPYMAQSNENSRSGENGFLCRFGNRRFALKWKANPHLEVVFLYIYTFNRPRCFRKCHKIVVLTCKFFQDFFKQYPSCFWVGYLSL